MPKVFLKPDSDYFLVDCIGLFPDGIPITSDPTDNFQAHFSQWDKSSLLNKLKEFLDTLKDDPEPFSFGAFGAALEPWLLKAFPKSRTPFYCLDSKALSVEQYQAIRKEVLKPKGDLDKLNQQLRDSYGEGFDITPEKWQYLVTTHLLNPNDPLSMLTIPVSDVDRLVVE